MSFLLKDAIHASLAESVYNEIISRRYNYYYFIGKQLEWSSPLAPETPLVTAEYEYNTRNDIILVKRIGASDVSYVVPRIDWATGTVFDQYDGNYSATNLSSTGASSIKTARFYVLTTDNKVYKCLYNNKGAVSTSKPSGTDLNPVTYPDGYVWKYLYTIPVSIRNRFLTAAYLPVQRSVTNAFYSNGEVGTVVIDSVGSGYSGNSQVLLNVNGQFLGKPGNVAASLRPILSTTGKILDVIIDNAGNNYKTASISIADGVGLGTSFYNGVSNVRIYNPGGGYNANVINNTTVTISTTGAVQPTSNAQANLIFSSNALVDVVITNPGSGYSSNARSNTSIVISTSGASQPTTNATANLFYTTSAKLTPVISDGRIDRVLIEDPGTGYSANIQTIITWIGDGTGAVFTPFINTAGELEDVIIESRGNGYTYIDLEVAGDGTGATVHADLSVGDLDTIQSQVEVSAIDGALYSFIIDDAGDNYTQANVKVYGDGTGFIGNVVLNPSSNTIESISVVNPGSGYKFANVVIQGNGSNANAIAIVSPIGGHGSNPVKELFADTLMFYSTINNEKNQGITVNNDYRQFGIIKDPKTIEGSALGNATASSCVLVTLDNIGGLSRDTIIQLTSDNVIRKFEVVESVASTKQVLLTKKDSYDLQVADVLIDPNTNLTYNIVSVNKTPTFDKFSGDLFFIDNRTMVSYSDQQLVTLRTIIRL